MPPISIDRHAQPAPHAIPTQCTTSPYYTIEGHRAFHESQIYSLVIERDSARPQKIRRLECGQIGHTLYLSSPVWESGRQVPRWTPGGHIRLGA